MCTSPASVICCGNVRTNSIELPVSRLASIRKYSPRKLTSRVSPDFSVTPFSAENRTFKGNIIEKRRAARLSTPFAMSPSASPHLRQSYHCSLGCATHFPSEGRTKLFDQFVHYRYDECMFPHARQHGSVSVAKPWVPEP